MRLRTEPSQRGGWRVLVEGSDAPLSVHDTEEEAEAALASYARGLAAAEAPTAVTGVSRGERVRLRDGREAIIRSVRPEDKPLLLEAFGRMGQESRYQRFLGFKKALTPRELAYFTEVDHVDHEALGALDAATGGGVGVARFIRERRGSPVAEAAVAVIDEWQGLGLGGELLRRLAERARRVEIERFSAALLTHNRAMLALFARLGEIDVRHDDGDTMRLTVALPTDDDCMREALRAAAAGQVAA